MLKLSLHKVALAAFGGATVLVLAMSATATANAATKFRATPEEVRRHCWRIDETFWKNKIRYGCGDQIACSGGSCRTVFKNPPPPPPPTYEPPQLYSKKGDGGGNAGGARSGGGPKGGDNGGPSGGGHAGGPN